MADKKSFVHLHLHTDYSVLDGALRVKDAVKKAAEWGMPALAMTDHGNLHGAVAFYKAATQAGVKPIIGMEAYLTSGKMTERIKTGRGGESLFHLVLLAKDEVGYSNLIQLSSKAYLDGFYYKPRLDRETIAQYSQGLIGMSACIKGEIPSAIAEQDTEKAKRLCGEYREIFGEGNFYLEVQENGMMEQKLVNEGLLKLSQSESLPLVATNDCHYLLREDNEAQDLLLCIQTGKALDDPNRMRFSSDQFYFKSPEEMTAQLGQFPGAIENTLVIADRCNFQMPLGAMHMPNFPLPEGDSRTVFEYLRDLVYQGAERKYGQLTDEIKERIEFELGVIHRMEYDSYFLIVWDFIRYAEENDVSVGPGRGSAAGSIVAYALNITNIEPLENQLLFERFLNPDRVSPPDIDIDFSDKTRSKIIKYVSEKYGEENVSQIATFGRLKAKNAIKDVGRALGFSVSECDKITKLMPNDLKLTVKSALESVAELREIEASEDRYRKLFRLAQKLEGLVRQTGVHAAGMIISDQKLSTLAPLMRANTGDVCAQFEKDALEDIGLIKMDFLGLKTLSFIDECLYLLKQDGIEVDIRNIAFDDEKTFQLLSQGDTDGVFQVESSGMKDLLRKLAPQAFADVIPLIALYRPGPLGSGMVDDFVQRRHGRVQFEYDHELLEPILKDTYGVILYQEQVMQVVHKFGGLTLAQADLMRRAMGKKKKEIVDEMEKKFLDGAEAQGISRKLAKKIFDLIGHFGGYGFNKSHSAAYAVLVYQTAYLKANYPQHFMAALLTSEKDNSDKVRQYMISARESGIKVLPPCVNESLERFIVSKDSIRFGLGAVKSIGSVAVQAIVDERINGGAFPDLMDFCQRVGANGINTKNVETLIRCGAFDCLGAKRSQLLAVAKGVMERANSLRQDQLSGQGSLFEVMSDEPHNEMPALPEIDEMDRGDLLRSERELLGVYLTGHPLDACMEEIGRISNITTKSMKEQESLIGLRMLGLISYVKLKMTKRGDRMAIIGFEDLHGTCEIVVYPELYQSSIDLLKEEKVVCIEADGEWRNDEVNLIASTIVSLDEIRIRLIQSLHLLLDLSEIRNGLFSQLEFALGRNQGGTPVIFHIRTSKEEIVVRPGARIKVKPGPALTAGLEQLINNDRFYYGYRSLK